MKKIRNYRLKGEKVFVGLEDSKKKWTLCIRSNKMIVQKLSMPAKYPGLKNFLKENYPQCQISIIYEAGFRGFNLYDKLTADGFKCIVTPPHTVTQEKCSKQKNDPVDARRLAEVLEKDDYKKCFVPDMQLRADRSITRLYTQVKKDINRISARIRRAIDYYGLEEHFRAGEWGKAEYRRAEKIFQNLNVEETLRYTFLTLFAQLNQIRQHQKEVLQKLRELAKTEQYKKTVDILRSAPSIGTLTAIRLALEWGDVTRFETKEQFAAFWGLIPSDDSTGEQDHKGHITKQGNRQVRSWLIESAWVAIRHDPVLLDKFLRIARDGTGKMKYKKKAIVAVARKLVIRLRATLIAQEPYMKGLIA